MADPIADNADFAVDELKRKARRRLVGAIVLALAAATLLPLLLEQEQKPLGDDVSIQIPPVDGGKFVSRLNGNQGKEEAPDAARNAGVIKAVPPADGAPAAPAPTAPPDAAGTAATPTEATPAAGSPAVPAPSPVDTEPRVAAPNGDADAKANAKPAPRAEPKPQPKAESKQQPKAETKAQPKAETKAQPKAEPKPPAKAEAKPQPKAEITAQPKAEVAAQPKAEITAQPKAEITAQPKAEITPQPKAEITLQPKAETTPQPKAEVAPAAVDVKPELAAATPAATAASSPPPAAEAVAGVAPPPASAPATESPKVQGYVVQLGAFTDNYGANALASKLRKSGYPAYTEPVETGRGTLWRVRVGGYPTRQAAAAVRNRLKTDGHDGVVAAAK